MRQNRDYYLPRIWFSFAFFAVLTCSAAPSFAQKTVVQDAGGGKKLEFDYNAAGQVTEQRTVGADGKLEQKVDYEHRPGYYVADQTTTFYWPDGKVHRITRAPTMRTANFRASSSRTSMRRGKQIGGHRLTHDPMTNVYTCTDWNMPAQDYKVIGMSSGRGIRSGSEEVKKFTYDEVMQHLDAARKAVGEGQKMQSTAPVKSTATTPSRRSGWSCLRRSIRASEFRAAWSQTPPNMKVWQESR